MPTKGRITTLNSSESRSFMFNPTEISDNKSVMWATVPIHGGSHPATQYGAGGERQWAFQLWLDGDRGQVARGVDRLHIADEIRWYRSLLYPENLDNSTFPKGNPQLVLFSLGAYVTSALCEVRQADVQVTYFTPAMDPVRATVDMLLVERPERSQTAGQVRNSYLTVRERF